MKSENSESGPLLHDTQDAGVSQRHSPDALETNWIYTTDDGRSHSEADIVEAWIKLYAQPPLDSRERDALFWAYTALDDMTSEAPDRAWSVILKILSRQPSADVFSNLAAGPLEALLARHGAAFIETVESEAARSRDFRDLLAGVWQNTMNDLWQRVQKAVGDDALVDAWMTVYQRNADSGTAELQRCMHGEFDRIVSETPKHALSVVLQILKRNLGDNDLNALASGPLESMLVQRGHDVIQDVETEAARSPDFRKLLQRVWENRMPEDVWKRVQSASQFRSEDGK